MGCRAGQGSRGAGQGGRGAGSLWVRSRAIPTTHPCSVYTRPLGGRDVNGARLLLYKHRKGCRGGEEGLTGVRLGGSQLSPQVPLKFSDLPASARLPGSCSSSEAPSTVGKPRGSHPEPGVYKDGLPATPRGTPQTLPAPQHGCRAHVPRPAPSARARRVEEGRVSEGVPGGWSRSSSWVPGSSRLPSSPEQRRHRRRKLPGLGFLSWGA